MKFFSGCMVIATLLAAGQAWAITDDDFREKVIPAIEASTGLEPLDPFNNGYCAHETFCEAFFGPVQVSFTGLGIVQAYPSSEIDAALYIVLCSSIFQALSGVGTTSADATMLKAFGHASSIGPYKADMSGVEISIRGDSSGHLGCRFFRK